VVVFISALALHAFVFVQTLPTWAGTWKLDLMKSRYDLTPAPRAAVSSLQPAEDGSWTVTFETDDENGGTRTVVRARFDGHDYPVLGLLNTTYAFSRIDDFSYEMITKRDGVVTGQTWVVVSPDGKTRTATTSATTPQGEMLTNVAVYERE
jgi:hypothetical protein